MTSAFDDVVFDEGCVPQQRVDEVRRYVNSNWHTFTVDDCVDEVGLNPYLVAKVVEREFSEQHTTSFSNAQRPFRAYRREPVQRFLHHEKLWSVQKMADELGTQRETIVRWMKENDVSIRKRGSQSWKGTKKWDSVREEVLKRDQYQCRICGISEQEHKKNHDRGLNVHHVVAESYFDDGEKAMSVQNLVTLCMSCHRENEAVSPRTLFIESKCR